MLFMSATKELFEKRRHLANEIKTLTEQLKFHKEQFNILDAKIKYQSTDSLKHSSFYEKIIDFINENLDLPYFKTADVIEYAGQTQDKATSNYVAMILRDNGYEYKMRRVEGYPIRVWVRK